MAKPSDEEQYKLVEEAGEKVLKINYTKSIITPSIEESPFSMAQVINYIMEVGAVSRIVFIQREEFVYDETETKLLVEIATLIKDLIYRKRILDEANIGSTRGCPRCYPSRYNLLHILIMSELREDPIAAYIHLIDRIRSEQIKAKVPKFSKCLSCGDTNATFIKTLEYIYAKLANTQLIKLAEPYLKEYNPATRVAYKQIFKPIIKPNFLYTKIVKSLPDGAKIVDSYTIDDADIMIINTKDEIRPIYHLTPPEYKLIEDRYMVLGRAREIITEHKPKRSEFIDPQRTRDIFFNVEKDLLMDLFHSKGIRISYDEVERLTNVLIRYTIGFGIIELLLKDPKIQDITVNSPASLNPITLVHSEYGECLTNITVMPRDVDSWATKLRLMSGRPLDEANPVLDTELILPGSRSRVAAVQEPLSPSGIAFAFRRHRARPWTMPLFIKNGMLTPLAAGLMSFIIDGGRTILVGGTRSAGKCVAGNTLIPLADGRIIEIQNLINGEKMAYNEGEVYLLGEPYVINTLNKYNTKTVPITSFWKKQSPKNLISIKTQAGREIITTPEHPYFTFEGSNIKEIFAEFISKGTYIATPRYLKANGKKIELILNNAETFDDYYLINGKTNAKTVKFPKYMTSELAEFLGYLWGDGCITETKIEFHNSDKELRDQYKQLANMFGVTIREFTSHSTTVVQMNSRLLSRTISNIFRIKFGKKADKIEIPEQVLMSSNEVLASFLRAYFDCDSHVCSNRRDIELVTASKKMACQLQLAFLRFGIVCFFKPKLVNGTEYYRIFIRGKFVNKFRKHIGFNHNMKSKSLDKCILRLQHENTNVDVIPNGDFFVKELRKRLRLTPKDIRSSIGKNCYAYETNQYNVTRKWFRQFIEKYEERYNQLLELKPQLKQLSRFIDVLKGTDILVDNINELAKSLNKSYSELSNYISLSDSALRLILQKKRNITFDTMIEIASLAKTLKTDGQIYPAEVSFLKQWIDDSAITYAELARQTSIPETTVKSYAYGGVHPSNEKKRLIEEALVNYRQEAIKNLEIATELSFESKEYLNKLQSNLLDYSSVGLIISELRRILNIQNEELANKQACLQTISNLFNLKYSNCSISTIKSIISRMIKIYDDAVSSETLKLLHQAKQIANSDIFWDKVIEVKKIDSEEKWVYDLEVQPTHNFVANGIFAHNTSLLGSLMVDIMRSTRIITVEDTLELPIYELKKLGYDIQSLKTQSVINPSKNELSMSEGIRTSLRMGDSSLIVGEVRSQEALALYEAMRVGALANVVAGTIHGDSPYGIFDRVVNDLKVPRTSFKATDIIIVCNPVKSVSGLTKERRIMQITEVRKDWEEDPLREKAFVDLMVYNAKTDQLEPTDALIQGESEIIKSIGSRIREWAGDFEAIWQNIDLRSKLHQKIVETAEKLKNPEILEADFVIQANDEFHRISEAVKKKSGTSDPVQIYSRWEQWLKTKVKDIDNG